MTDGQILDMLREALWVTLVVTLPLLAAALLVGLAIGLLQALTSVQEMTLTFVPKLAAMGAVLWVSMAYMGQMIISLYTDQIIPLIAGG